MRRRPSLLTTGPWLLVLGLAGAGVPAAQAQEQGAHMGHGDHGDPDAHAEHKRMLSRSAAENTESFPTPEIPHLELVDQDGRTVRFFEDLVAGRVVAINFIFTTCTTICPPMGATFSRLQERLGDRLGDEVALISVSVDPDTDTPARLKEWGERFGAGPGWTLVTGQKGTVNELLRALGTYTPDAESHAPVALLADARSGTWRRAYGLTAPQKMVEVLEGFLEEGTAATRGAAAEATLAEVQP